MPDTRAHTALAVFGGYSTCMTMVLALFFVVAAQSQSALGTFESMLTADPENLKIAAEYRQAVIASSEYDRAIKFFEVLDKRPGAGPNAALNLGLAYIDKIPTVGAFRRISLGNNATAALTRSIERQPSEVAYTIRGLVNLRFEKGFFHRTPAGVADLEMALRLASAHPNRKYVATIYLGLGDGYWRLKNHEKARETWKAGQMRFPHDDRFRQRLTSPDNVVSDTLSQELDAGVRVDTSLRELFAD
jgi:tetratricopeptide (TPR) repeat protein